MLSLEKIREIEPDLKDMPDDKLEDLRNQLYTLAELALDTYFDDKKEEKI